MRRIKQTRTVRLRSLPLDIFVVLACCHLLEAGPVNADGFAPLVDPEIRRAIDEGSARVLVEVRLLLLRRFETVPFLALDIDADALTALENMGDLVVRVVPDRTMAPAPRP